MILALLRRIAVFTFKYVLSKLEATTSVRETIFTLGNYDVIIIVAPLKFFSDHEMLKHFDCGRRKGKTDGNVKGCFEVRNTAVFQMSSHFVDPY